MSYAAIQDALVNRFLNHFDELSDTRCRFGKLDEIVNALLEEGADYACYFQFGGGREQNRQPMEATTRGRVDWVWRFGGVFMLRYRDDVDMEARETETIDKLSQVFKEDPRLENTTIMARFVEINEADVAALGQDIFDFIPFIVEVIDR